MYPAFTVLSVPRGLYRHKGVMFPDGRVIHASKDHRAVVLEPLATFAGGRPLRAETRRPRLPEAEMLRRGHALLGRPYRLVTANCEHLIAEVLGHDGGSPQLRAWAAAGCLVLVAGLAAVRARRA